MEALAWIGQIFEWIGRWIPRWVVLDSTEAAVKYVRGKPVFCESGRIHWYWPAMTTWQPYPVARQTDRLESQTMETMDGKTFIVAGILTYRVRDLMLLVPTTHSPSATVIELAASAVHNVCCQYTWEELQAAQRDEETGLHAKLKREAQRQVYGYGVEIIKLQLTSLARCRVLKVLQSTSSEEN